MPRNFVYILFFVFFSCSNSTDDDSIFEINTFPQHWELKGMSTGISGGFLEGSALPWSETIVLEKNKRFLKTRLTNDSEIKGEGNFEFTEINCGMYLILNYDTETDLIESCGLEKQTETLFMSSVNSLTGGAAPFDGPGLFYERVE